MQITKKGPKLDVEVERAEHGLPRVIYIYIYIGPYSRIAVVASAGSTVKSTQ